MANKTKSKVTSEVKKKEQAEPVKKTNPLVKEGDPLAQEKIKAVYHAMQEAKDAPVGYTFKTTCKEKFFHQGDKEVTLNLGIFGDVTIKCPYGSEQWEYLKEGKELTITIK